MTAAPGDHRLYDLTTQREVRQVGNALASNLPEVPHLPVRRVVLCAVASLLLTATAAMVGPLDDATLQLDIQLTASPGPGRPAELRLLLHHPDRVSGFELVGSVDAAAAEIEGAAGLAPTGRRLHDLSVTDTAGRVVVAAQGRDGLGEGSVAEIGRIYVTPTNASDVAVRLGAATFVDRSGKPMVVDGADRVLAVTSGLAAPTPDVPWQRPAPPRPAGELHQDVDENGRVNRQDAVEVFLDWQRTRLEGRPCGGTALADLDGNGCVDLGDVQIADRFLADHPHPIADAPSSTWTVNDTGDASDSKIGNGVCSTSAGVCTLRAAIQEANARAGQDTINFAIPGTGPRRIQLTKHLPALGDASGGILVNGYTQPGSSPNTDPVIDNAVLTVEVEGTGATNDDAFVITSAGNELRGLAVFNTRRPVWIHGSAASGNTIRGNFIGTNASATFVSPTLADSAHGIHAEDDAPGTTIGGTSPADRNVISGNARHGIGFWHSHSDNSIVQGNIVGLSPDGTRRVPNRKHGVDINFGVSGTLVGGTAPGERNVLSGNDDAGQEISHTEFTTDNHIIGNYIGTDVTGNAAPAYTHNLGTGIYAEDGSGANEIAYNVIGGNDRGGVQLVNGGTNGVSRLNHVHDNLIGQALNGSAIPNGVQGVRVDASDSLLDHNVIANNNGAGIVVGEADAQNNHFSRNSIFANTGIGIDLFPAGVTQNDADDSDAGPNGLLNWPVLDRVTTKVVQGHACANCTVEVFVADAATTRPAGKTFVVDATTGADGTFTISTTAFGAGTLVTATATDPAGATSEFAPVAASVVHNDPPDVTPDGPFSVIEGGTADLSATAVDPDGDPVTIDWDLDDDGTFEAPGATVTLSGAGLEGPATLAISVRGRDPMGASTVVSVPVTVVNAAPAATASAPASVNEGSNVVMNLTNASDPSPADVAAGLHFAFSCDGSPITAGYASAGTVPSVSCPTADGPSSPQLRGRVLDRDGAFTDYTVTVGVANVAPSASLTGTPSSLAEGATATFGAEVSDPSAADTAAGFTYAWTGRVGTGPMQTSTTPGFDFIAPDNGTATIALTVTDKDGGAVSTSVQVPVTNAAPTAMLSTMTAITTSRIRLESPVDGPDDLAAGLHYAFSCEGESLTESTYEENSSTTAFEDCTWTDGATAHPVRARVIDKDGAWTEYGTDAVLGDNSPVVNADPASVSEGGSTTLTATASTPPETTTYEWDLDGNGSYETEGRSVQFLASGIDGPGTRDVSVRATDADGRTGTSSAVVSINNVAPTATLPAVNGPEGTPLTVALISPSDPSTDDTSDLHYAFSCTGASLDSATYASASSTPSTPCSYDDGPFLGTVRARVIDDDGAFNEYTASVQITNVVPSVTISGITASPAEGTPEAFDITITDPSSADRDAGLGQSWTVTRDGTEVASGGTANGSFTPDDNGSYVLTASATDKDGGIGTTSITIAVGNVAPTATPSVPASSVEGQTVELDLTGATDPSPVDTTAGLRYQFACDGELPSASYESASTVASASCTFDDEGTRAVALRVIDKDGDKADYGANITVGGSAPVADVGVPNEVVAGEPAPLSLSEATDVSAADRAAGFSYAFDCGAGFGSFSPTPSTQCTIPANGGTVSARVRDKDGLVTTYPAYVASRPNLIANGGFESDANSDGIADSWTIPANVATSTSNPYRGSKSLAFSSPTARTSTVTSNAIAIPRALYTARAWVDLSSSVSNAVYRLRWYDSGGTLIKTTTLPTVTGPTGGWQLISGAATAPAGTATVAAQLAVTTNGSTAYVDDVAVYAGNQLGNPGFETDTNSDGKPDVWFLLSRFTRDGALFRSGSFAGKVAGDGSTIIPRQRVEFIQGGRTYAFSVWVNAASDVSPFSLRPRLRWYSSGQTVISVPQLPAWVTAATPGWVQLSGTAVAPANATAVNVELNTVGLVGTVRLDDAYFAPTG